MTFWRSTETVDNVGLLLGLGRRRAATMREGNRAIVPRTFQKHVQLCTTSSYNHFNHFAPPSRNQQLAAALGCEIENYVQFLHFYFINE